MYYSRIKNRYFTPHEHFVTSVFYEAPTAVTVSHENMFKHIGNVRRSHSARAPLKMKKLVQ